MAIIVEERQKHDQDAIEALLDQAFGIDRIIKVSYRLREGNQPIPELALVVRDAEISIIGTIDFWPVLIGKAGRPALLLGPLAVHNLRQNRGIGCALAREAIARARFLPYELIILIGDASYYKRVGFQEWQSEKLLLPGIFDSRRLLFLELQKGAATNFCGLILPPWRYYELHTASSQHSPGCA